MPPARDFRRARSRIGGMNRDIPAGLATPAEVRSQCEDGLFKREGVTALVLVLGTLLVACGADEVGGGDTSEATSSRQEVGSPNARRDKSESQSNPNNAERGRPSIVTLPVEPRLPPGSVTYRDRQDELEITYPSGWERTQADLTPRLSQSVLAAGSFPLHPPRKGGCAGPASGQPQVRVGPEEALVHILEEPNGGARGAGEPPRRFRLLKQVAPVDPADPTAGQVFPWNCASRVGIVGYWGFFGADGRVFYITVIVGESASLETREQALGVLDSLRFG